MDPRFRLVDERAAVWNGRPVELDPSEESATGYLNVCYQAGRSKPFYAKAKVDEGKPRTIPGTYSTTILFNSLSHGTRLRHGRRPPSAPTSRRSGRARCRRSRSGRRGAAQR